MTARLYVRSNTMTAPIRTHVCLYRNVTHGLAFVLLKRQIRACEHVRTTQSSTK